MAVLAVAAMCAGGIGAAEAALRPGWRRITDADRRAAAHLARVHHATLETNVLTASDGACLRAWLFAPDRPNRKAVIVLHGVADTRASALGYASLFLPRGYTLLAPDSRAHGESGGGIATYGVREADDVNAWARWVRSLGGIDCVYGIGNSMGGAILIQALGRERQFCAAVAESPFSTFREAAYLRAGQPFAAGETLGATVLRPFVETGLLWARLRHGLDLDTVSPADSAVRATAPILLIHGALDRNIPQVHSDRIAGTAGAPIEYWRVPTASHTDAFAREPAEYSRRVIGWFERERPPK